MTPADLIALIAKLESAADHAVGCNPAVLAFAMREAASALTAQAERIALEKAAYEVLSQELDELRSEVAELEKDAARYRWGVKHARWIRHEDEAYVAIPVALNADLSCEAMRDIAIDAALAAEGSET